MRVLVKICKSNSSSLTAVDILNFIPSSLISSRFAPSGSKRVQVISGTGIPVIAHIKVALNVSLAIVLESDVFTDAVAVKKQDNYMNMYN